MMTTPLMGSRGQCKPRLPKRHRVADDQPVLIQVIAKIRVLANVADGGGARIVERLGGKAVATSSAAMAWSHGYQEATSCLSTC